MCASSCLEGELIYLFNAQSSPDCETPFMLQGAEDAVNYPLDLPENHEPYSLWKLREHLLAVEVSEHEACEWTWPRIVAELRGADGYARERH